MKRSSSVIFVPLALALALPSLGAPRPKHGVGRKARSQSISVRTYRNGRILGLGLVPGSILSTPTSLSQDEQQFVELVNQERARRHLVKLSIDPVLVAAARQHSREMAEMDYFDHYSPVRGLRSPIDRYAVALGTRKFTCIVGENLFFCSRRDVPLGHESLMKSPGHRANILADDYRAIGVGAYLAPDGQYYVTQMFHT
ncbi:MAG: hypothetical protein HY321_16110 [Armatimonadetes bacterium]|nr:hypothetical protein [Armatimonadota bacterium]